MPESHAAHARRASLGLAPILVEAVFATVEKIIAQGPSILLVEQNIFYAIDWPAGATCWKRKDHPGRPRAEFTENPRIKEAYLECNSKEEAPNPNTKYQKGTKRQNPNSQTNQTPISPIGPLEN